MKKKNLMKGGFVALITALCLTILPLAGCKNEPEPEPPPPPPPPNSIPVAGDYTITGLRHLYKNDTTTEYKVSITPKEGKSSGAITVWYEGTGDTTYEKSITLPSAVGTYAVTFDVAAATGWDAATGLIAGTMIITDIQSIPEEAHYNVTGEKNVTYDGTPKSLTVTPKEGDDIEPSDGEITVWYEGKEGTTYTKSETLPTNAGTYTVTFDVAESDAYTDASGLSAGTLTIAKATPVLAHYDIDNLTQKVTAVSGIAAVTTTLKTPRTSYGTVTVSYEGTSGTVYTKSTTKPTKVGSFTVTFDVAEGTNNNAATGINAGTLEINVFKAIDELGTWLGQQTANNAATAFPVALNVSSFGAQSGSVGNTLIANKTKYVSLDLSGSTTFTAIPNSAFSNCTSLVSVTLPTNAEFRTIGQGAFYDCTSLESVTIPNSVRTIEIAAFSGCSSLASVTIGNSVTSIGQSAFQFCPITSLTIPDNVTSIGNQAFYDCNSLASVTIGNGVTSLNGFNFIGNTNLTSITIGNKVASIGQSAFGGCTGLTSVTIPASVTSIGQSAFGGCTGLTSVTFATGSNISDANFASAAFDGNLKVVYLAASPKAGTYTTTDEPVVFNSEWTWWTKQP